ncbi:hypothetical protein GUITHDRAFT_164089 [Guillardia theta CCMP2712]|uniref:SAP domain-containing protein n=1 Tax=Guillardia theta (strain CCMP2712) TaxID=905079 RepID=L1J1Q7_GUITC|nr:hypothetical protein GUITHDRAFT_164089 [Guillardia theta CCMP2712]EKX42441.1 hypothetical protein GUITHDRAFT_164089 [Guillardia theta CCMP2712]|eukprot:XP_005829421.1 hypothetical protein GUITHDRAFT_164089 [Guillardia theta CCMP2712]
MDSSRIATMKVVELRKELEQRGLDCKGLKAELVNRLQHAVENEMQEQPQEPENQDAGDASLTDEALQQGNDAVQPYKHVQPSESEHNREAPITSSTYFQSEDACAAPHQGISVDPDQNGTPMVPNQAMQTAEENKKRPATELEGPGSVDAFKPQKDDASLNAFKRHKSYVDEPLPERNEALLDLSQAPADPSHLSANISQSPKGCRVQIVHTVTRAGRFEPRPIEITGTSPQFEAIRKLIADKLALPLSSIYDITSNTTGTGSAGHERPPHSSERSSSIYNMLEEKTQAMDQKPIPVEEDRKRALPANVSRNEPCSQTITIPNAKVGFVVGKNASSLRNLEMYFGTRVFIARECPSGPFSAVERTKDHILSQIQQGNCGALVVPLSSSPGYSQQQHYDHFVLPVH